MVSPKTPFIVWQPTMRRGLTNSELLPENWPQPLGPAADGWAPQNVWLWKPMGAHVQEIHLFKCLCTDSLTPETSAKAALWQAPRLYGKEVHLLILKCLPEEQRPAHTLSRDGDTGRNHFCAVPLLESRCPSPALSHNLARGGGHVQPTQGMLLDCLTLVVKGLVFLGPKRL